MKYVIVTRDGKGHRITADSGDLAVDKLIKRKNNSYLSIDIAAVVGYNDTTKKDPHQQELF